MTMTDRAKIEQARDALRTARTYVNSAASCQLQHRSLAAVDCSIAVLDSILAAPDAQAAPAGFKLVPLEPTEAMLRAAADCQDADPEDDYQSDLYFAWKAMLAAAPAPSTAQAAQTGVAPAVQAERDALLAFFGADSGTFAAQDSRALLSWRARLCDFLQAQPAAGVPVAQAELWPLILAYAAARVDCDRSNGSVNQQAFSDADRALRAALASPVAAQAPKLEGQWQPIETAPKDGTHILAFWPLHPFGDDDNMDESKVVGGVRAVTFLSGNYWVEPDYLDATGAWFGDDCCHAPTPTHWQPLPAPPQPDAAQEGTR
jgi:hypothetical protein